MTKKIIVSNIEIDINRKNIKNMYLRVSGHDGRVSISAPLRMKNEEIIKFVTNKIQWIEKQKRKFENSNIQYKYDYVDGEIHYLWGKPYVLRIVTGSKCRTDIIDDSLILTIKNDCTAEQREKLLTEWYRRQLKDKLPVLFDKWEKIIGVHAESVSIRNMKSRWGSCNTRDKRISINLQLAKRPIMCLEYVVVHELVHLLEASHNHIFKGYMDKYLPEWRGIKRTLRSV
ncbi:MAG: M48 family metallopeptidase [Clostridiales bacterium]|jgi:predicted metal-dependent hydrolase|nr:M48 family metallopeptidase [Clostridiales bacterium]